MSQAVDVPVTAPAPATPWQPTIVALVCNWCTYTGADMAGTSRRTYAPNVRIVRFLCTGRLDPLFIVKAFENGADGVIASGCHPGDCHYVQGNYLARRRFTVFQSLMDLLGLDRRRLHLAWVSASEGVKWASVVDQATAAVREAGPLGRWAAPVGWEEGAAPALPEPAGEPRTQPSGTELTAALRETAAGLLAEGRVAVVVGHGEGSLPGQTVPVFVTAPEDAERLVWDGRCSANLAVHLPEALRRRKGQGRIGLVVKSCDEKAVAGLLRENQLTRDDVVLVGAPCEGVWPDGKLAYKCYACDEAVAATADITVGDAPAARAVAPDPRDAQLDALAQLSPEERRAYWQPQLDRCIRCYACRAVCPLCYCASCIAEKNRPQWIQTGISGPGNTAWNVARAMHLAGRCVGCDECARACPADIRLDLLNRHIAREIEASFGYRAQSDPAVAAALTTFRPDDPGEAFL